MLYGGVEFGGTKTVCAIGEEDGTIIEKHIVPTTSSVETLNFLYAFFKNKDIKSLGIGSFGPIDLNKNSKTYGFITTTPKIGWNNVDVLGFFKPLNIPLAFDTDVNVACLGEINNGAGITLNSVIYGTIGTGIGFGAYIDGQLIHGLMHTEVGHMLLSRHEMDKNFIGPCPYHDNCLETLASGPSIEKRWGKKPNELYDNKCVWDLEAYYISQALTNCILCYSPERIILGGGIMHTPGLMELVRQKTLSFLNGYIKNEEIISHIDKYIVLPKLGDDAGVIGAIELGKMELKK